MRILDVTPISNTAQFPIKKGTLQFLQDAHKEVSASILKAMIGSSYSGSTVYVLSGCVNSGTYPVYNITAGVVFYFGEVFQVDAATFNAGSNVAVYSLSVTQYTSNADPVTFTDTTIHNIHNVRQLQITAGASGSGIKNYSDSVFYPFAIQTYADLVALTEKTRAEAAEIVLQGQLDVIQGAWTLRSNIGDVTVGGGSGTVVTNSTIKYLKFGKTVCVNFSFQVTNTTAPTSFYLALPVALTNNTGFEVIANVLLLNGTAKVDAQAICNNASNTFAITPLSSLTNTIPTNIKGSITFEIA